ncbi:unnamed protein product [Protopolystoma xenopodis]|uniref:Uncharacterized protein n=1 Tax=Protopolystoma xenopodis TaxID=117903 RepID=A0A448X5W4_9PLAT|nr:unnamed protein product [Protopolystoma xenopodis]
MLMPRCGVGLCTLHGCLYAVGGQDGIVELNTVERYDPVTNIWEFVAPMLSR